MGLDTSGYKPVEHCVRRVTSETCAKAKFSPANVLAMSTGCFWPPDNELKLCAAWAAIPTGASAFIAIAALQAVWCSAALPHRFRANRQFRHNHFCSGLRNVFLRQF